VLGTVRKLVNAIEDRKVRLIDRLAKLKADKARLMAFDTDKDGHINAEEWDGAVQAEREAMLAEEIKNPPPAEDDIVIAKGEFEDTLLIADSSEKDLIKALAWKGAASAAGGFALILATTVSLVARLGMLPEAFQISWRIFYR
jgi:hypothetical protein